MPLLFHPDRLVYTRYDHWEREFRWSCPAPEVRDLLFHGFWTGVLGPYHHICLKSLLLTQSPPYQVWLWMPPRDLERNQAFVEFYRAIDALHFRPYSPEEEARGTVFEGYPALLNGEEDCRFWQGKTVSWPRKPLAMSNVLRLLALGKYGGIYFDMDTLFLRDFRPLCGVDFIYQWSNKPCGTNAISHFVKDAPAVWALAEKGIRRGIFIPPVLLGFSDCRELPGQTYVLPSFLFDPVWIAHDTGVAINGYCNSIDEFFDSTARTGLSGFFPWSYSYDWHNHWDVPIRPGSLVGRLRDELAAVFAGRFGARSEG